MIFMVNPAEEMRANPGHHLLDSFKFSRAVRRSRKKRRSSTSTGSRKMARKRRTAAQKAATRKLIAFNRRRKRGGGTKRRRRSGGPSPKSLFGRRPRRRRRSSARRTYRGFASKSARRRRRSRARPLPRRARNSQRGRAPSSAVRRAGRTLRRRRWAFRGNPGYVRKFKQGLKDAGAIAGGEMVTNFASNMIPFQIPGLDAYPTVQMILKRSAVAFVVGYGAERAFGYDVARMAFAGGLLAVVKTGISKASDYLPPAIRTPVQAALSGEDDLGSYPMIGNGAMGSYPMAMVTPGMGSYPPDLADDSEPYYPG